MQNARSVDMADFDLVIRVGTAATAVDVLLTDVGIRGVCSTAIDYSRKLIRGWERLFSDLLQSFAHAGPARGIRSLSLNSDRC
jgi:hypothetical protein